MIDLSLIGIFTAGVLTFFAPCVLPLIPIYLSALVGADIRATGAFGRAELIVKSLIFSTGFILVFSLLGLSASVLGGFLRDNKIVLQLVGAAIIFIFALKFIGILRIPALDRVLRFDDRKLTSKIGLINAFVMGAVFAAGWSPCVGPILGSVLTYTAGKTNDMFVGALYLAVYGAGFAVPLIAVAVFAQAGVALIRKSSRYMPVFDKIAGVLLLLAAVSMTTDAVSQKYLEQKSAAINNAQGRPIASANFNNFPVMVEFYSSECPICKQMAPMMEGIKSQCHGQKVEVLQIDVTKPENRRYVKDFRLLGMPTFVFFDKNAFEAARLIGAQTENTIKQALSVLRGSPCPGVSNVSDDFLEKINGGHGASCGNGALDASDGLQNAGSCGAE